MGRADALGASARTLTGAGFDTVPEITPLQIVHKTVLAAVEA